MYLFLYLNTQSQHKWRDKWKLCLKECKNGKLDGKPLPIMGEKICYVAGNAINKVFFYYFSYLHIKYV